MNIATRLNSLEKRVDLFEGKGDGYYSIIYQDKDKLYYYESVDGQSIKKYPTQEELDDYRNNHKEPIIIIDMCLDLVAEC